jgi:hypothetical protein
MDIRHHLRILWRWRAVLAIGLVLGSVLAVLVTFKVSPGGAEWRSKPTYTSTSRTIVTQRGFPLGRAALPMPSVTQLPTRDGSSVPRFAPAERMTELAVVYSYIAKSDQVKRLITPVPLDQQINVAAVSNPSTGDPLPLMEIATTANTSGGARALNRAVIQALKQYLQRNGEANGVPQNERVTLDVLNSPPPGALVGGRTPTLSVVLWLLALAATLVAVYVLENLYPSTALRRDQWLETQTEAEPELVRPRAA